MFIFFLSLSTASSYAGLLVPSWLKLGMFGFFPGWLPFGWTLGGFVGGWDGWWAEWFYSIQEAQFNFSLPACSRSWIVPLGYWLLAGLAFRDRSLACIIGVQKFVELMGMFWSMIWRRGTSRFSDIHSVRRNSWRVHGWTILDCHCCCGSLVWFSMPNASCKRSEFGMVPFPFDLGCNVLSSHFPNAGAIFAWWAGVQVFSNGFVFGMISRPWAAAGVPLLEGSPHLLVQDRMLLTVSSCQVSCPV